MQIDHVHFYVDDAKKWRNWFIDTMNFGGVARGHNHQTHTEVLRCGDKDDQASVTIVLSSALNQESPVAQFLRSHPPGIQDVAFRVNPLDKLIQNAINWGTHLSQPIQQWQSPQGRLKWTQISAIGSLKHTLIERQGLTPVLPYPWLRRLPDIPSPCRAFKGIDHLVLNVEAGKLERTVQWYQKIFSFQRQQTFIIQTQHSALHSQVMIDPEHQVQIPINEPTSTNSQIQEFLDANQGPGIQHMALKTHQITEVIRQLRAAGLSFLSIPRTYYTQHQTKFTSLNLPTQEWQDIMAQEVLVDYQPNWNASARGALQPLLLQIFTQPIFSEPTFFFEFIERRCQAQGFGEGNFQALFEAIEREQLKRGSLQP